MRPNLSKSILCFRYEKQIKWRRIFLTIFTIIICFILSSCGRLGEDDSYDELTHAQGDEVMKVAFLAVLEHIENEENPALLLLIDEQRSENIQWRRTLYDNDQNRFLIEYFDLESFAGSLWTAFVVIDASTLNIIHFSQDIQLYSGITPEMALHLGHFENELHNEFGEFYEIY